MYYSTENLQISLTLNLASFLRERGFSTFWHSTAETEATPVDPSAGTIAFIAEIPANPTPFVRLKSESGGSEEIVVPALTLHTYGSPRRMRILGLGHREYEWERDIQIDAFAADDDQQRRLADLLHEWLQREELQELPVSDFRSNAVSPTALEPVRVVFSDVRREDLVNENAAVRYYIRVEATLQYVE